MEDELYGTCKCGNTGKWREDPYVAEIHGCSVYAYICEDCYYEACMDI